MPALTRHDHVFHLDLGADENRFSPDWIVEVNVLLDEVIAGDDPAALVTHGGGKFYSNGLDLDWLLSHPADYTGYVDDVHALLARVLTLPVPTVAAVNGHAFGAGAMIAMAHDFRVMRADRGYFCFPEADIDIPFTPGMAALIQAKLVPSAAVASMTTAVRFGGPQALEIGLVDATATEELLLAAADDTVSGLAGKKRATIGAIKATMFGDAVAKLAIPQT